MRSASTGRRPLISDSPCRVERSIVVHRAFEPKPATPQQIATIVENMPGKCRALILLAVWCGVRGSVSELRRKDVDLASMTVRVDRAVVRRKGQPTVGAPKSRAGVRTIALPQNLRQPLRRHLAEHAMPGPVGLLFPNAARTGRLHVNTLFRAYHRAGRVAGCPVPRARPKAQRCDDGRPGRRSAGRADGQDGHSTTKAAGLQHVAEGRDRIIAERMALLAEPALDRAVAADSGAE